jgi:hypothetical protein
MGPLETLDTDSHCSLNHGLDTEYLHSSYSWRCTTHNRNMHDERALSLTISGFRTLRGGGPKEICWLTVGPGGNTKQVFGEVVSCCTDRCKTGQRKGQIRPNARPKMESQLLL